MVKLKQPQLSLIEKFYNAFEQNTVNAFKNTPVCLSAASGQFAAREETNPSRVENAILNRHQIFRRLS